MYLWDPGTLLESWPYTQVGLPQLGAGPQEKIKGNRIIDFFGSLLLQYRAGEKRLPSEAQKKQGSPRKTLVENCPLIAARSICLECKLVCMYVVAEAILCGFVPVAARETPYNVR